MGATQFNAIRSAESFAEACFSTIHTLNRQLLQERQERIADLERHERDLRQLGDQLANAIALVEEGRRGS